VFGLLGKQHHPIEVVNITTQVNESFQGKYFFGQTDLITFGGAYKAWGGLFNPADSGVNLFFNVFTVSNFTSLPFTAEIWFNSIPAGKVILSTHVTAGNQSLVPPSQPKINLKYASNTSLSPTDGVYAFLRRIEPNATLTRHDLLGMIIIPHGGSLIVLLKASDQGPITARIAFGWWEQRIDDLSLF
jgi:hypothetical protein